MYLKIRLNFKKAIIFGINLIIGVIFCSAPAASISLELFNTSDTAKKLIIIHTNDLHSRLAGYAPESEYTPLTTGDDNTTGGFARIASIIKQEKDRDTGSLLVLDAGDFLMGTFFHALEPSDGFQLRLMKEMGYDAVSIGNHEFDFGISSTAEIISNSAKKGQIPPVLLSNIKFDPESVGDDGLEALYSEGIVRPYLIIEKNGLRIGIFGILGYDASDVAPYIKPAKITDPVKTARKITDELKTRENVDMVICLSHSGVSKDKKGNWDGEDVHLASKVKDIDIIISGHTHTCLPEPIFTGKTIIVQTGAYGANIGKIHLSVENKHVKLEKYEMIPINDSLRADSKIHGAIENQKKLIQVRILDNLGINYDDPVITSGFDITCYESEEVEESNLGPLLADAIRYYVNNAEGRHTDISLIAAGVIRDQLVTGTSSIADIFRISSMGKGFDSIPGYPLSMVYVTGNELKKIIEVLLFAYKSNPGNYCYYSGLRAMIDPSKGFLRKVISIEIEDGAGGYRIVDFSRNDKDLNSIAANAYILEFVGLLKKMTFGIVKVYPKNEDGNIIQDMREAIIDMDTQKEGIQEGKEWIALYKFISQFQDVDQDGIPDVPSQYKNPDPRIIEITESK